MEILSYSKRQQPGWIHYIRVQLDYPASVVTRNFETWNENRNEFDAQLMSHSWSETPLTFLSVMDKNLMRRRSKVRRSERATLSSLLKHPQFSSRHPSDRDLQWQRCQSCTEDSSHLFDPILKSIKACSQYSKFRKWPQARKQNVMWMHETPSVAFRIYNKRSRHSGPRWAVR